MKTQSDQKLQRDIAMAVSMCLNTHAKAEQIKHLAAFLVEKTASYPDFLEEVVTANRNISYEWLLLVRKVGRNHVYLPLVYHYQTPGVRRICRFEISQQKQLWNAGVLVAVPSRNGFREVLKSICNLSNKEVFRVFSVGTVRTIQQQIEFALRTKAVPVQKYTVKGDKAFMNKCVLDKREVGELATKILTQDDIIALLTKTKKMAA